MGMRAFRTSLLSILTGSGAAAALLAAPALAAPTPDRVLAEVSGASDVSVDGRIVVWSDGRNIVVHDGTRVVRRTPGAGRVDVGKDARSRRVVAFTRCGRLRCALRVMPALSGPSRLIATATDILDVTVGGGRAFWIDGSKVRSRSLTGGTVRTEVVAGGVVPAFLDTDGRRLAVSGPGPDDEASNTSSTIVSLTRVGSGRARVVGGTSYSQEFRGVENPVVTRTGVAALFTAGFGRGPATKLEIYPASGGRRGQSTGGMPIVNWDTSGDATVFLEAATGVGCGIGVLDALDPDASVRLADAPCRVVVARTDRERLLPPRIRLQGTTAATVRQTTLRAGKVTGSVPQVGVTVEERDAEGTLLRTSTTDAGGRVALGDDTRFLVALTASKSYAALPGDNFR